MNPQLKHLKALKRRRKLEKKSQHREHISFTIELIEPRHNKLKNFEEVALSNIHLNKIIKELYFWDKAFNARWKAYLNGDSSCLIECVYTIINKIIEQGGSVPPYLIPRLAGITKSDDATNIIIEMIRPQRDKNEGGTIYHFGGSIEYEGREVPIWFTGHSLDRLQERLDLTKKDVCLWMLILGNLVADVKCCSESLRCNWSCFKDDRCDGGYKLECGVFGMKVDGEQAEARRLPLFFGGVLDDNRVIIKTSLLPGMCGTPVVDNFGVLWGEIIRFWRVFGVFSLLK